MIFVTYLIVIVLAVLVLLLVFLFIQLYQIGKLRDGLKELKDTVNLIKGELQNLSNHSEVTKPNVTVIQTQSPQAQSSHSNEDDYSSHIQDSHSYLQHEDDTNKKKKDGSTKKQEVMKAILKRKEVEEEDLPMVIKELSTHFSHNKIGRWAEDLNDHSYYRLIDLRKEPSTRVVVIGDIHCDYYSLTAILLKLSVSEYDYFGKAYFVFLGDYLDRGACLFEPLLLLKDLKEILGDRMIMLKGNHESISYDAEKQTLKAFVRPNDSCECLKQYCNDAPEFLNAFAEYYRKLPTYVYLKTQGKNILMTHASIPRDIFLNTFKFDEEDGHIQFETIIPEGERLMKRKIILKDMIWGDPKDYDEKMQVEGRFEFGRKQFERFYAHNHIDLILRSHEEAPLGHKAFFGDRLYTIFSTGGSDNPQTGYPEAEPAFAVIQGDSLKIENSFLYQCLDGGNRWAVNLFSHQKYYGRDAGCYQLSEEFMCDAEKKEQLIKAFKDIKSVFPSESII